MTLQLRFYKDDSNYLYVNCHLGDYNTQKVNCDEKLACRAFFSLGQILIPVKNMNSAFAAQPCQLNPRQFVH